MISHCSADWFRDPWFFTCHGCVCTIDLSHGLAGNMESKILSFPVLGQKPGYGKFGAMFAKYIPCTQTSSVIFKNVLRKLANMLTAQQLPPSR